MSVLKFRNGIDEFDCTKVLKLDTSFFSLKNQFTGENGNSIIYPVKMHKARISFTVEVQGDYNDTKNFSLFMKIINQAVFECEFKFPESEWSSNSSEWINLQMQITSDITVVKVMSKSACDGGLYAVSATLEEV